MSAHDPNHSGFPVPPVQPPPLPPPLSGSQIPNRSFSHAGPYSPQHLYNPGRQYSIRHYVDPGAISTFVIVVLAIGVLLDVMGVLFGFLEWDLLSKIQHGYFESEKAATTAAGINDTRVALIAIAQTGLHLLGGILFLFWTWRFCKNAHCLTNRPLPSFPYDPAWAVGWYFVPFANIVMPFIVLWNAYRASCHPADWKTGPSSFLLVFWWIAHLFASIIGQASFRMGLYQMRTEDPEIGFLIGSTVVGIASDFSTIVLNVFTILVVFQCNRMQQGSFAKITDRPNSAPFPFDPVPPTHQSFGF